MDFKQTLDKYRKIVDDELKQYFAERISEVNSKNLAQKYTAARDYVLNGGKRLRPVALIMAYKGLKGKKSSIYRVSLSVELMHNSTLVHDDIMDEDDMRRNKPTVHKIFKDFYLKNAKEQRYQGSLFHRASARYSVTDAICIGNILQTLGLDCLLSYKNIPSASVFSKAFRIVNDGQMLDNEFEITDVSEAEYLDMIARKTGNLFRASVQIGALLANASEKQYDALSHYSILAAMAFQMQDDIMDISKFTKKGSTYASDIKNGKHTLLLMKAMKNADSGQKKVLNSVIGKEQATIDDINRVIKVYEDTGTIDYVIALAEKKIMESKRWLAKADLTKESHMFFEGFADYMLSREI